MRTLQIGSGYGLAEQIRALRTVHDSNEKLLQASIDNLGGLQAQSLVFERQAEPIVRPIERAIRGEPREPKHPLPYPRGQAPPPAPRPAPPSSGAPPTAPPPPPTAAPPAGPSTPPRGAPPPAGPSTPVSPSGEILGAVRRMAATLGPIARDVSLISLSLSAGGLTINKQPVTASLNPLQVGGHTVTPDLAQLLIGGSRGVWPTDFLTNVTSTAIKAYRQILASTGITDADLQRSGKGQSLLPVSGKGLQTRKPPKSTSARVQPDGTWGDYKVDLPLLHGGGILRLTHPTTGEEVLRTPASSGLKHLLLRRATKRQGGAGLYAPGDVAAFRRISQLARVPVPRKNNRRVLAEKPGVAEAIFIADDPKAMTERLNILLAAKRAGNSSERLLNEGSALADRLLKKRELSKKEHESIVRELLAQP